MAPRLSAAKKPGKAAPAPSSSSPPPSGDNANKFQAEEAQFLSFLGKLQATDKKVDVAKAAVKVLLDERKEIISYASAAGFKAHEFKDILEDMKVTGSRKNVREAEARRSRFRKYVGLPVGNDEEQLELVPQEARDALDWEGDGYLAGMRALEPKPPKECPARFVQAWMKGYHDGQARNGWALEAVKALPDPKAAINPAPPARPSTTAGYEIVGPSAGPFTIKTPAGEELAKEYASADDAWNAADAHLAALPSNDANSEDDFEMTDEERAAQAGRDTAAGRPSAEAGYRVSQLEGSGKFIIDDPAGEELDPEFDTEEEAWNEADDHFAASKAKPGATDTAETV